jgi:hypothetical protein
MVEENTHRIGDDAKQVAKLISRSNGGTTGGSQQTEMLA